MKFLGAIKEFFKRNPSDLHSKDLHKRIDRAEEIVATVLKQHRGFKAGRKAYSMKMNNTHEYLVIPPTTCANQGGIEIYAPHEETPEALVHFEDGIPRRPTIFVKKVRVGKNDCQVWKNIANALQKEGKYQVFKPRILLVDRDHSLSAEHFYDSQIRNKEGKKKPVY